MTRNINRCARVLAAVAVVGSIGLSAVARGDATGPYLIADLVGGSTSGLTSSTVVATSGTSAYFRSNLNVLWRTNGRPGGTSQVDVGLTSTPIVVPTGGVVYTRSNTTGGASLQFIGASGTSTLIAQPVVSINNPHGTVPAIVVGSRVLYSVGGTHIMSWDSLTGATEDLGNGFLPNPTSDVLVVGSRAFAIGPGQLPVTLTQTDGTAAGTSTIGQYTGQLYSTSGTYLQNGGTEVCFTMRLGTSGQYQMYGSDGTAAGTRALGNLPTFSNPTMWSSPSAMGIYAAGIVGNRSQLWHFGATATDTGVLLDFPNTTRFVNLGSANGLNVFADTGQGTYTGPSSTARMWITSGDPNQTLIGPTVSIGQDGFVTLPNGLGGSSGVACGDEVYFMGVTIAAGIEPWHVNTQSGSIGMISELSPGTQSSSGTRLFGLGFKNGLGVLSMVNFNSPMGTTPGLWFLKSGAPQRFVSAPGISSSITPIALGNRIIFGMNGPGTGVEPYAIDLCPADYDNSGILDSGDVFAFLNDWLANNPNADFDKSGGPPAIDDIFGFLNGWIAGCQ